MNLEQELTELVAELRKHKASHDSILLHALMHNRKSANPWHEDAVRRFIRSCDAPSEVAQAARKPMTPYNIVVRSETVGGVELKDFDEVVGVRTAEAAERRKIIHAATESQRMVPVPEHRRRGRPPGSRNKPKDIEENL